MVDDIWVARCTARQRGHRRVNGRNILAAKGLTQGPGEWGHSLRTDRPPALSLGPNPEDRAGKGLGSAPEERIRSWPRRMLVRGERVWNVCLSSGEMEHAFCMHAVDERARTDASQGGEDEHSDQQPP